jgi:hypothetical protein
VGFTRGREETGAERWKEGKEGIKFIFKVGINTFLFSFLFVLFRSFLSSCVDVYDWEGVGVEEVEVGREIEVVSEVVERGKEVVWGE